MPDEDDAQGELAFRLQNRKEDTSTDTAQTDSKSFHLTCLYSIGETSDIESISKDEPEGTIGKL